MRIDERKVDFILRFIEEMEIPETETFVLDNGNGIRLTVLPENYKIGCTE